MVFLNKITTKGGDGGETGLADGSRVAKDSAVMEAIGATDECNTLLGIVRLQALPEPLSARLQQLQNDLFDVGADLVTPIGVEWEEQATRLDQVYIARLESWIEEAGAQLQPLKSFILPGGSPAAAYLHQARAVARRAERAAVAAWPTIPGNDQRDGRWPLIYLNRLSDLLFQWCRLCNDAGASDVLWQPGGGKGD